MKIQTQDASGQDSTEARKKLGALMPHDKPPPSFLPPRVASHLRELRKSLGGGFSKVLSRLHSGKATNAETEALGVGVGEGLE